MDAKEKAKELIKKMNVIHYYKLGGKNSESKGLPVSMHDSQIKGCVLVLIDENVKMLKSLLNESTQIYQSLNTPKKLCIDLLNPLLKYWNEVKQEVVNYENKT